MTSVRTRTGRDVLSELGERLDELHRATGAPVTARRPWLEVWAGCYPGWQPLAVVVDGDDGSLEAAALLATRPRRGRTEVVVLGHGTSDYAQLSTRTPEAAGRLGEGIARMLEDIRGPWTLRIEQLPEGDTAAAETAARLPSTAIVPGDPSPLMRFEEDRSVNRYLSKNARQTERSAWNRIRRDDTPAAMALLTTEESIERVLPEMEVVRRLRDTDRGRRSDVQDPAGRCFWRQIVLELARRGQIEIVGLWLEGRLAAYVTCVTDGSVSRMWDARFDPAWSRYSAGRITDLTAFHRARTDPSLDGFDWMRGGEDYKRRLSDHVVETQHLLAWSSGTVRRLVEVPKSARRTLGRVKDRSEVLTRAWVGLKRRTVARNRGDRSA